MELQAALLVVAVVLAAYMPVFLTLYVRRRRQAHVRCRQPLDMAFAAACVMVFALADPLQFVLFDDLSCYWHVVWAALNVTGRYATCVIDWCPQQVLARGTCSWPHRMSFGTASPKSSRSRSTQNSPIPRCDSTDSCCGVISSAAPALSSSR